LLESNLAKHGIRFADATVVFDDPLAARSSMTSRIPWSSVKSPWEPDAAGRILVVVYAWRR
jgi:uncharacterized DUF497 family protein